MTYASFQAAAEMGAAGLHTHGVAGQPHLVTLSVVETIAASTVIHSRSSTARSDETPRAVWLLTAPMLMPVADAIWASVRSA